MIVVALKWLVVQAVIGCGILVAGLAATWLAQGFEVANRLGVSSIVRFNGVIVWTLGWGLASFIRATGHIPFHAMINLVQAPEDQQKQIARLASDATSHRRATMLTIPISVVGGATLLGFGYPHGGFARVFLAVASISIYYVAAYILHYFVSVLRVSRVIDSAAASCDPVEGASMVHLETLGSYLSVSTVVGVLAIYAGFQGTVTADFVHPFPEMRSLLGLPLVLFLPGTLVYHFYPRYVVGKVYRYRIFDLIQRLCLVVPGESKKGPVAELERIIIDLREVLFSESRALRFVSSRDVVTSVVWLGTAARTVAEYDPTALRALMTMLRLAP